MDGMTFSAKDLAHSQENREGRGRIDLGGVKGPLASSVFFILFFSFLFFFFSYYLRFAHHRYM
jgi:hypothetical protein